MLYRTSKRLSPVPYKTTFNCVSFNSEIGTADRSAVVIDKSGYVRQVNKYQFRSVLGPNGYGIVDLDFNVKDLISFIEDL